MIQLLSFLILIIIVIISFSLIVQCQIAVSRIDINVEKEVSEEVICKPKGLLKPLSWEIETQSYHEIEQAALKKLNVTLINVSFPSYYEIF